MFSPMCYSKQDSECFNLFQLVDFESGVGILSSLGETMVKNKVSHIQHNCLVNSVWNLTRLFFWFRGQACYQ